MKKILSLLIFSAGIITAGFAQVEQTLRYELEKKNDDDYFHVLPAGEEGLVIFRDIDKYDKSEGGDIWEITSLDTNLAERWKKEVGVDIDYVFKGFEMYRGKLFLLFTQHDTPQSDLYLLAIDLLEGEVERFDIKNEIKIELSHLTMAGDHLILAGYVRSSPTVVSYRIGNESGNMKVVPGFFKDRSDVVDLRTNENATFNILTLEKGYQGHYLRLRTHAPEGDILFEKTLDLPQNYKLLSGKTTDFVDGNIAVTGTYGNVSSGYAVGIYFAIVKPEGQKDVVKFYGFRHLQRFFDYMGQRRAARIRKKIERKEEKGKEYRYNSRLLIQEVRKEDDGYLLEAEIYDPESDGIDNNNLYHPYYNYYGFGSYDPSGRAYQRYARKPGPLVNTDQVSHFEYLQSVVVKLDNQGELVWDNSMKIDDVETYSLEQVVDFTGTDGSVCLLYKSEDELNYKIIDQSETVEEGKKPILLKHEHDNIGHTYKGRGKILHWYGDHFLLWGYHRVENKEDPDVENKRSVLFINKVKCESEMPVE